MAFSLPCAINPVNAGAEESLPKTLTVAYLYNGAPPLSYTNKGEHTGILIDIVKEIGKRAGIDIKMKMLMREEINQRIAAKKIDGVIVGIYHKNDVRKEGFLYSEPFLDDKKIMQYKEKHYQDAPLFDNENIIMQGVNNLFSFISETFNDDFNAECRKAERGEITYDGLNIQKDHPCDNRSSNYVGIQYFQQAYFFPLLIHNGIRDIDFSLQLSPSFAPLLPAINKAIQEMKQEGAIDTIMLRYVHPRKKQGKIKKKIVQEGEHHTNNQLFAFAEI